MSKLINYEIFIEKRPDMEIHTESSINSCINSAYSLLDGECAGLISQVDKFNIVDDRETLDKENTLYRNDFELNQLQEALIFQVQYVLNMGNDFTIGGGSYSIGNVNSSYNRPEGRELIAPGVYKLLSNARVYQLNAFGSTNKKECEVPLSTSKEIMERVKNEYVAINQPNAEIGSVAVINQSNQVSFSNPQDLQITTYNTKRIAGGEGHRNNFYEIDHVPNIAFFGPNLNGTYSAVHRGEIQGILDKWIESIDIHTLDGLTRQEIYNAIIAGGGVWSPLINYSQGFVVIFPLDNVNAKKVKSISGFYGFAKSLQNNNLNNNPNNSPDYWEIIPTAPIDLVALQEYIKQYIDNTILPILKNETIPKEVEKQIKLKEENFNVEGDGATIEFQSPEDFEKYKTTFNVDDSYFEDVEEEKFVLEQDFNDYKTKVEEKINTKQDKLTAGNNIAISNNEISWTPPEKINVLFGWEPNTNGNYYRENAYDLVLPSQVIDSNKRFMAIFYFGTQMDGDRWWDSVTLPYSYYNTDKYKQVAELIEQVGKNFRDSNERIRAVIYRGRLKAVDSWRGDNQGVLYGIRFIEI